MARERKEMEFDVEDFSGRMAREPGSGRQSITIPEGLRLWNGKKPGVYRVEFIPFLATEAHNRFLPELRFTKPGKWYSERTFFVHDGVGVNNDKYACPAANCGLPCPICDFRRIKGNSSSKEDAELAYSLKPKKRQMFLILDHAQEDKGVQLWEESHWAFGRHLKKKLDGADAEDVGRFHNFYHPLKGLTVKLIASEASTGDGGGKYTEYVVDDFRERREPLDVDLFRHGFDLDAFVRILPYDELKEVFLQGGSDKQVRKDKDKDKPKEGGVDADLGKGKDKDKPKEEDRRPERVRDRDEEERPAKRREDDDRPAPKGGKVKWAKGDPVVFKHKDKEVEGTITEVKESQEVAYVEVEGKDRPVTVDLEDLRPGKAKGGGKTRDEDDDRPARRREPEDDGERRPSRSRDAEDDGERRPARREPEDDDRPRTRQPAARDEDDDRRPARREAEDDRPAAKTKPKGGWDDDDDESFRKPKK